MQTKVYFTNADLSSEAIEKGEWKFYEQGQLPGRFSSRIYSNREAAEADLKYSRSRLRRRLKKIGILYNPPQPHCVVEQTVEVDFLLMQLKKIDRDEVGSTLRDSPFFKVLLTGTNRTIEIYNSFVVFMKHYRPERTIEVVYPGGMNSDMYGVGVEMVNQWEIGEFFFSGKFGLETFYCLEGSDSREPDDLRRLLQLDSCVKKTKSELQDAGVYAPPTIEKLECLDLDGNRDNMWLFSQGYPEGYAYEVFFSQEELIRRLKQLTFNIEHPAVVDALQKMGF